MLLAPALLALAVQTPAQSAPAASLADLVPKDTVAFVQAPSLERAAKFVERLGNAFAPAGAPKVDVAAVLALIELPGDAAAVDPSRPVGICLGLAESEGAQPLPTFLIPVRDAEAFLKSIQQPGSPMKGVAKGGYACIGLGAAPELPSAPAAIAKGLPEGEIAARLDLGRLIEQYREQIDMGIDALEAEMDSVPAGEVAGIDPTPVMGAYADGIRDILDSAETLDVALRLEGDELELGFALTNAEGSPLANFGSKEKTGMRALAGLLDTDSCLSLLMGMDMAAMMKRFQPLFDGMPDVYPEAMRPAMKQVFAHMGDLYSLMGSAQCASMDFASTGMRYRAYFPCQEPQKLLEAHRGLMKSMPGFGMSEIPEHEVGGVKVAGFRVKMDFTELLKQAGDQEPQAQMDAIMERLFGKDGIALQVATKDGTSLMVMGGDEDYLRESIARMSSKSAPPAFLARALAQVGDLNPCMIVRYDLGRMMEGMKELMSSIEPGAAAVFSMGPLALSPMIWGGVDGRVWRGALSTNLSEISALVRKQSAQPTGR